MIFAPTNRRIIRPGDKPSFEHTQRYGLIKGHWANTNRVGLWPFNEGSGGRVFDLSGRNMGTINGALWVPGKYGSALAFTDDYINLGQNSSIKAASQSALTVIYSINVSSIGWSGVGFDTVVSAGKYDASWSMSYNGLTTYPRAYAFNRKITCGVDFGTGQYTLAFRANASRFDWYKNGIWVAESVGAGTWEMDSQDAAIGCSYNAGSPTYLLHDSILDWVIVYNRFLSASEIAQLYREPFLGIEKRTAPVYFFVPTGGVIYQELNLAVTADASIAETDTHAMVDTGKAVQADAAVTESDTQQMLETGKAVEAAAVVSCTDLKVIFELNLEVNASGSAVATDAHTMIETGKVVTAIATPAVIDTQAMVEIDLGVSADASVSCTDTMGLLAHIAAFMILRQCTT